MPQVPGPAVPHRVSAQPQPIRSPHRPPLPAECAPAKTMSAVTSKPAEALDDLLSDLNQAATGSDFPPPLPMATGTIYSAEGPGISGEIPAKVTTWFQVSGGGVEPAQVAVRGGWTSSVKRDWISGCYGMGPTTYTGWI